ncbi:hypothetical protein FRC03_012479 [Tulasnella sp. 419]|nr:hypothetical protein FRC03_012479 [Tulasnella sp. 419]
MATPVTDSTPLSKSKTHLYEAVDAADYFSQKPTLAPSKSPSYGPHKSLGLVAWYHFLIILFWSLGMGSVLLIWLLVKRVHPPEGDSSNIFSGYLVIDEGNRTGSIETLDGEEILESRLTGVLIITAISHFSTIAIVPLMALGAFYIAAWWLDDQVQSKDGPTPLQFGLIVTMCSSGSWDSFRSTFSYLFRRWTTQSPITRAKVSPLVYLALVITGIVVALHYSLIVTDLLLTAEVGSAYYTPAKRIDIDNSPIASQLGTRYRAENSSTHWEIVSNYIGTLDRTPLADSTMDPNDATGYFGQMYGGLNGIVGRSSTNYIAMINTSTSTSYEDESSMALVVRPPTGIPPQWGWTAPTIGMTARCQPAPCDAGNDTLIHWPDALLSCPKQSNVTWQSIPLPSFDYLPTLVNTSAIGYRTSGEMISFNLTRSMTQPPVQLDNPTYLAIRLQLERKSAWSQTRDKTEFGALLQEDSYDFYAGLCEVTMYDVKISFKGSSTIASNTPSQDIESRYLLTSSPIPMSSDHITQMLSPLMASASFIDSFYQNGIMPSLQAALLREASSPRFSATLSSELAKYSLAFISELFVTPAPATDVIETTAKLVSRYPLTWTLAYIGVVYAHGLLGIILYAGLWKKSSRTIVVDEQVRHVTRRGALVEKKQKPVQELLLVQSRLTDPLTIIAEHFLEPKSEDPNASKLTTPAGALSAQDDVIKMFDMEGPETKRVDVGIIDRQEGERWFGLRHRRNDVLVVDSGKEVGNGV